MRSVSRKPGNDWSFGQGNWCIKGCKFWRIFINTLNVDIFPLQDNIFWSIIASLTKPAVVAGILLTMTVIVYYLRAKSRAHTEMVKLLKEMLYLEGRDKAFLISSIKQLTNNTGFLLEDADFVLRGKPYMRHSRNNSCTTWVFAASPTHSRNPSGNNPRENFEQVAGFQFDKNCLFFRYHNNHCC